jgi:hypothetical protein
MIKAVNANPWHRRCEKRDLINYCQTISDLSTNRLDTHILNKFEIIGDFFHLSEQTLSSKASKLASIVLLYIAAMADIVREPG